MASNYLGPEIPQPFALISESYQNDLAIPDYPEEDQYRFGEVYEEAMFSLIHTHLELGTTDRFCYIGEEKGTFAPLIERKFCLIRGITKLNPGIANFKNSLGQQAIMYGPACSEADQFFKNASSQCTTYKKDMFDRVMLKDCIHTVSDNLYNLFHQIKSCLHPEGKILIVHRPGMLNTLPLPKSMVRTFEGHDVDIGPILNALQDAGFDVKWDIEMCPVVMPKVKWLSMIQGKHPADLEKLEDDQIQNAIRELTEGMFKYEGDIVQFTDRLLFISASPGLRDRAPTLTRYGSTGYRPPPTTAEEDLSYRMHVTPEIQKIIDRKRNMAKANVGRTRAVWN